MSQKQIHGQSDAVVSEHSAAPDAQTDAAVPPQSATESDPPAEPTTSGEPPSPVEPPPVPEAGSTVEASPPTEPSPSPPPDDEMAKSETAAESPAQPIVERAPEKKQEDEDEDEPVVVEEEGTHTEIRINETASTVQSDDKKESSDDEDKDIIKRASIVSEEPKKKKKIARRSVLDEDYEVELARELDESDDSVGSVGSAGSYVMQKEIIIGEDFFDALGDLPSLDDISSDITLDLEIQKSLAKMSAATLEVADTGRFVDPLTGLPYESSQELVQAEPEVKEEVEKEEEEDEGKEDDDLLVVLEVDDDVELEAALPEEDVFETFLEMETGKQMFVVEDIDWEKMARDEAQRQLEASTAEFLRNLVNRVVDQCEYIDPKTILRQNLDKMKLIQELQIKLGDLDIEQKARLFLNRKTVEFFRRKKAFRPILEDNPETVTSDIEKLIAATAHLDRLLGDEEETKTRTDLKIYELESKVFDMKQMANYELISLEELIRKTLIHDTFDRIKIVIDVLLSKMASLRKEISKVRYVLIQRQHTLANLIKKLEKLENLGNGLRMRDFEHLQTETQALDKKIEERNAELNKLRTRCNADLHIMAHMKEKQQMMRNTIAIQVTALDSLAEDKQLCRERLFDLKLNRGRIRLEINELSFQGGLIDKPPLMIDYDTTVDKLEKLHVTVNQLRTKLQDTSARILAIEAKCGVRGL